MHFENAIYRVLRERKNITAPFAEHLKFKKTNKKVNNKQIKFTHSFWVNSDESKEKLLELGHYMF